MFTISTNAVSAWRCADDPRFWEIDFGNFGMLSCKKPKGTRDYQAQLTGDNESNVSPEGKSGAQIKDHDRSAFSEIQEDSYIITHGGVIAAITEHLFINENKTVFEWQSKRGRGYAVEQHDYRML